MDNKRISYIKKLSQVSKPPLGSNSCVGLSGPMHEKLNKFLTDTFHRVRMLSGKIIYSDENIVDKDRHLLD